MDEMLWDEAAEEIALCALRVLRCCEAVEDTLEALHWVVREVRSHGVELPPIVILESGRLLEEEEI